MFPEIVFAVCLYTCLLQGSHCTMERLRSRFLRGNFLEPVMRTVEWAAVVPPREQGSLDLIFTTAPLTMQSDAYNLLDRPIK
jgi:hypothetical protein